MVKSGRTSARRNPPVPFLSVLGRRIRSERESRGLARDALARESGLSMRFLAQVEAGAGNISIARLHRLAGALGVGLPDLLREEEDAGGQRLVLALLGLRGAGKSTLGREAARRLGWEFVEHDRLVEDAAGMSLGELFSLHGDAYYRRLSRETLQRFLDAPGSPAILATAGGVVADPEAFEELLRRTTTLWLSAKPEDHWNRVVAQGDARPMRDRPEAMAELRRLLQERVPLYSRSAKRIDTSSLGQDGALRAVLNCAHAACARTAHG